MIDEQLQQQIEDYLGGNLPEKERAVFEEKMQQDKALKEEVKLYRELDDLLGESDVMDFSNTLSAVMKTEETVAQKEEAVISKMRVKSTSNRRWLSIAAGIALVAVLSVLMYNQLSTVSPNDLYSTNMEFPSALGGGSALRSTDISLTNTTLDQINANWKTASEAYQQNQFSAALMALDEIEKLDPSFELEGRDDFYFKKGLVQLKLDEIQAAIASFEQVKQGDYVANAQWKRALALLKVDVEKATVALEEIVDSGHSEKEKAMEILKKL